MKILITGAAGFIGFSIAQRLLKENWEVVGIDSLNNYYSPQLKKDRLALLPKNAFTFYQEDLANTQGILKIFADEKPEIVLNLGGQAGVRYSITNPYDYIQGNLVGFGNILECCRNFNVQHLLYASSSSVYGLNTCTPFQEKESTNHPVSLYAATKKSNELMAHSYSHLYKIPTTGLRFFTVYGPWGRPDMAPHLFTSAILANTPIKVFNHGKMQRDFTYIDDIVESVIRLLPLYPIPDINWSSEKASPDPSTSSAPYRIYNVGNGQPIQLMDFIIAIEKALGKTAIKEYYGMQDGDVKATLADTKKLQEATGFKPNTLLEDGIHKFISWHTSYYD